MVSALRSLFVMVFAMTAAASPIEAVEASPAATALDFHWRFYSNGGCDHNSNPGDTWPSNGSPPGEGNRGACYSAPTGTNWNRVEIDNPAGNGLIVYCDINCQGGSTAAVVGVNCFSPVPGCAIGSLLT